MNATHVGILVGGVVPAVIFGLCGVCIKASNHHGIGTGYCLLFASVGALAAALVSFAFLGRESVNAISATHAFLVGATWAGGVALMSLALTRYHAPISVIGPLTATACLITALLALWFFSEWKDVHVVRLLAGAILIVVGAMLVSTSSASSGTEQSVKPGEQAPTPHTISDERVLPRG